MTSFPQAPALNNLNHSTATDDIPEAPSFDDDEAPVVAVAKVQITKPTPAADDEFPEAPVDLSVAAPTPSISATSPGRTPVPTKSASPASSPVLQKTKSNQINPLLKQRVEKALETATKAIEADNSKRYLEAEKTYSVAIKLLSDLIAEKCVPQMTPVLQEKLDEYTKRREKLRTALKKVIAAQKADSQPRPSTTAAPISPRRASTDAKRDAAATTTSPASKSATLPAARPPSRKSSNSNLLPPTPREEEEELNEADFAGVDLSRMPTIAFGRDAVDMCHGCGKRIDDDALLIDEHKWHEDCVVCVVCKCKLGSEVHDVDGAFYCANDAPRMATLNIGSALAMLPQMNRLQMAHSINMISANRNDGHIDDDVAVSVDVDAMRRQGAAVADTRSLRVSDEEMAAAQSADADDDERGGRSSSARASLAKIGRSISSKFKR